MRKLEESQVFEVIEEGSVRKRMAREEVEKQGDSRTCIIKDFEFNYEDNLETLKYLKQI